MKKGISQEGLKIIACLTMLIDHIGYCILYPMYQQGLITAGLAGAESTRKIYMIYVLFRIIGRLSLPIFCFLLVEGAVHTRSRKNYGLRLLIGAFLAELPYNLAVSGSPVWRSEQSVMLTLLLGYCMILLMEKVGNISGKALMMIPFAAAAEILNVDYGWGGIVLIGIFVISQPMYNRNLIRFFAMVILFHYLPSNPLALGNITIPRQVLGALSMLFIAAYDGRKLTHSKTVQWAFYLFYPVHLLLLYGIRIFL